MLKLPEALQKKYAELLFRHEIPPQVHHHYKKWLRFYLDFCQKYQHPYTTPDSLIAFLEKLKQKKQSDSQRDQAGDAVQIYYSGMKSPFGKESEPVRKQGQPADMEIRHSPSDINPSLPHNGEDRRMQNPIEQQAQETSEPVRKQEQPVDMEIRHSPSDITPSLPDNGGHHRVQNSTEQQAQEIMESQPPYPLENQQSPWEKAVVLSREEVDRIILNLKPPYNLVVKLLYGCGLRLSECMKLRLSYFNFDQHILTIHDGKGQKDRTVPLPESIESELLAQVEKVAALHQVDLDQGYAGVFLPGALERKYKNAEKELAWQWFFPAKTLTLVAGTDEKRRYHLHETHVQKAIKRVVKKSKIIKEIFRDKIGS